MAESVPICDVLSQAMEYLTKLGTNIRIRSEKLKDKRIRKDKLRNTHAIHKVVDKVLLICELSKKSIENVETGVKNLLLQMENDGATFGQGPETREKSESGVKFEYFTYESRKLKIRDKISVAHYTSVKVVSMSMTLSMIEKYPVYHDCKLYRMRKKKKRTETNSILSERNSCKIKEVDDGGNSSIENVTDTKERSSDENEQENILPMHELQATDDKCADSEAESVSVRVVSETPKYDGNSETHDQSVIEIEQPIPSVEAVDPDLIKDNSDLTKDDSNCEPKPKKRRYSEKTKRFKHIKVIDSTSSSDNESGCGKINPGNTSTKNDSISEQPLAKTEENTKEKESSHDNDTGKPMIKCVSLTKLLKPEIVKDLNVENKEESKKNNQGSELNTQKITSKSGLKKGQTKSKKVQNLLQASKSDDEDTYWSNKRKEVKDFKPKEFNVCILRLPKITPAYLEKHGLKKITHMGSVICYLLNDSNEQLNLKANSHDKNKSVKNVDVNKVKNSLLYDSDSDNVDTSHDNIRKLDKPIASDPDSALIKNNDKGQKSKLYIEKQNAMSCESDSETSNKPKRITASECEKSNDLEYIEKETEELGIQIAETTKYTQEKEEENSGRLKKSLLADSECGSQSDDKPEESALKNALLADSDCESEDLDKTRQNKCDKSKKGDLKDKSPVDECGEDNDNQKNIKDSSNRDSLNEGTDIEDNLLSRQSKTKHRNVCTDPDDLKSNLLQDSSDDISKSPKKRKSHSGDSPPQSKRKNIRESIYAKKMLLTYSSSSDTEDEQLRNTLKGIRDYLLNAQSSEEDDKKDKKNSENEDETVKESTSKKDSSESESEKEDGKSKSIERSQSDSDSKETSSKDTVGGSATDNSSKLKVDRSSATPEGSCSQNSDIQDDKEIDGLTNLESLKKSYRRKPTGKAIRRRCRRRNMANASGLISNEGFLEAESSSDGASLSGSEHADNVDLEDMPRVKLADINGDGIAHLAKDDLLGESDTSVSHDEKKDYKKEEDTDEDNVKSKRRKAIAISSDSEAGSSRRKDHQRVSDFEDSEDDNSEPVKNKRKKKVVDSDASGGSSDDGKKKRRRIKTLDESDGSGSDTENEGRNKHGRKNIRKVMSKNQLEEATKKAARQEKERIARIAERQKLYNNLEFDESGKPDEVVLEKVVLDFDPETKEPLIQVDRGLVKKLKPHQANGIKFMWDACFESVKRIKKDKGSGCILAHCMGLGKTLQVVSLTHTLLTHGALTGVSRVLVVCPLSTVLNWVNEFRMWLKHAEADYEVDVYELSKFKQNSERAFQLSQWFERGGVCVLGYEMFRNLSADKGKKFKKKILKNFQESLVDPGPDLVVCDEGHLLKNEKTSLSQSMNRVKTLRRIVLTGTPLQNNLKEYYCMVQFVKPNLLGKYNEYLNRFVNPITNGQYTDSTEHDIRVMKRRSHVLHKMLDGAVQRRDYGVLAPFLPPKHEYVLFITLTDVQIKLYHHYLDNYSRRPQPGKSSGFLFPDFQSLQRIWTHPLVLKYNSERYEIMQQKKREREEEDSEGSLVDFIDDDSTPDESSTEESSDDLSDMSDDSRKKSKKKKSAKKSKGKDSKAAARRGTRANPIELDEDEPLETLEVKNENPTEWWMRLVSEEELEDMRNSHKLILLFDILRQCEAIGDKLLVFSQSLYSLDLIEHFLGKVDEATQAGRVDDKLGGHVGSWSPGVDYFRLDGSTSCENRSIWCKNFNRIDNQRARLFLISTRAGGLGINLVAANRVVIFDVSWNPSHDVQSIFRVYRFGQKKPCYVYRFLAMGTMEEKIYERQVTKQAISKRVIDEQQIDRHYAENDLAELYKFEPQPPAPRPLPPLPKDRLFAEMLKEHEAQIYKYHEHDSLLENKEEETLSEEERRAAWEDFENEKTRPPPQPFLSPYAMHNGMVQGLLAQQQQMAMATISAMLRKDMPSMTDQQLRETVPLILASNPGMFGGYDYGLMQKMSEIYKYAQPGMMNPAMMNPMNAAAGGMSGASGLGGSALHYEPPWQRQQQQQQQLRMQQLMQHQNSMGAKYYAGGLGSRDPMAMALQQQRARELMHRPRARGRPPLAGAPPAPAAGDVVNLDSD